MHRLATFPLLTSGWFHPKMCLFLSRIRLISNCTRVRGMDLQGWLRRLGSICWKTGRKIRFRSWREISLVKLWWGSTAAILSTSIWSNTNRSLSSSTLLLNSTQSIAACHPLKLSESWRSINFPSSKTTKTVYTASTHPISNWGKIWWLYSTKWLPHPSTKTKKEALYILFWKNLGNFVSTFLIDFCRSMCRYLLTGKTRRRGGMSAVWEN